MTTNSDSNSSKQQPSNPEEYRQRVVQASQAQQALNNSALRQVLEELRQNSRNNLIAAEPFDHETIIEAKCTMTT